MTVCLLVFWWCESRVTTASFTRRRIRIYVIFALLFKEISLCSCEWPFQTSPQWSLYTVYLPYIVAIFLARNMRLYEVAIPLFYQWLSYLLGRLLGIIYFRHPLNDLDNFFMAVSLKDLPGLNAAEKVSPSKAFVVCTGNFQEFVLQLSSCLTSMQITWGHCEYCFY